LILTDFGRFPITGHDSITVSIDSYTYRPIHIGNRPILRIMVFAN